MSALNGYNLKNGGKSHSNNPVTKKEMEELMRQFPD
jgi:hypothetical protein|tara:strand:- start:2631 stop:2738 length:108 start_codon:yes stop_codon:yes gene_type:complete